MPAVRQNPVTPRDIARVLFRHRRKMILFTCGAFAVTLLAIALYPRSYASESKLLIRIGRESVALDPTATTGETITLQKTQEDEVNSALNILTSREVLERAAVRIGCQRIIDDVSPRSPSTSSARSSLANLGERLSGLLRQLRLSDPGTEVDQAVRQLEKRFRVTAPKQSMVITVKYTAASPQLAHDVVEAITDTFLDEHTRLNQTDGSLRFFAEQAEKLHSELANAQAELRDRKNAYQRTSDSSRLSILENARDAMRERIYDLQLQESELRSRYTNDYPPLREIQRQRENAERLLTELPRGEVRQASFTTSVGHDPAVQQAHATLNQESRPLTSHDPPQPQDKLESEVQTINDQEFELAQLAREVELLEGKYRMHVEKLEQARVNSELGRERITNVKVAQPATLVYKPVSPVKSVMLSCGTLVALCGGIGLAFVAESVDQTLRTTSQVEAQLGLPVLASLAYRKRRKRRRAAPRHVAAHDAAAGQEHGERNSRGPYGSYHALLRAVGSGAQKGCRTASTVGVVGCEPTQSRSRVAARLAIQAAWSGASHVLLIDADPRSRHVSRWFHLNGSPGWRDVLVGSAAAENCIQPSNLDNLDVLAPGSGQLAALPVGSVDDIDRQLSSLRTDYELIVVDLPPARELDRPPAFHWIDHVVIVVEAERTRIQAAQRAKELLDRTGVHVAGVVLANRREHVPRWLYQRL